MEWTQKLFIEHADLFLRVFKLRQHGTPGEVEGLAKIFAEYRVPKRGGFLNWSAISAANPSLSATGLWIRLRIVEIARGAGVFGLSATHNHTTTAKSLECACQAFSGF